MSTTLVLDEGDRRLAAPTALITWAWVVLLAPTGASIIAAGWGPYRAIGQVGFFGWAQVQLVLGVVGVQSDWNGYSRSFIETVGGAALGGATLAVWIGAMISLHRRELVTSGVAMLGYGTLVMIDVVWTGGGPTTLLEPWNRPWVAAPVVGLVWATGVGLTVAGDVWRRRLCGISTGEAHAVAISERRWDLQRRVEDQLRRSAGAPSIAPGAGVVGQLGTPVYATWGRRVAARLIDWVFTLLVFVPVLVATCAAVAAVVGADIAVVVLIAVYLDLGLWELVYYLVGASHGQTVGKRLVGIRVCREDGSRLGPGLAFGRQLASLISTLAFMIGWLAPLWTPKRQTWQDQMTNTIVIEDRSARLDRPSVVWGLVWTVISGLIVAGGLAFLIKDVDFSTYDSGGYETYETNEWGD